MSSNGYELGTAKTFDSTVPKFQDLSGDLPTGQGDRIRHVYSFKSVGELLLIVRTADNDSEYYRSTNDGRSWDLFWETGQVHQGEGFETAGGSFLFSSAGNTYRYTGGGETPSQVLDIDGFGQGPTQTDDGDIYILEYGGDGSTENNSDVYKSTDDGQTWQFVANVVDATSTNDNSEGAHGHGITSQGDDRLFVAMGDEEHDIIETDDEFETYNKYVWNAGTSDPPSKGVSYTGIHCENNALILGADHSPTRLTYMWVGGSMGDVPTSNVVGDGEVPRAMFHVMVPPKLATESQNSTGRYSYNSGIRAFFHRIKSDGNMLYANAVRNNILAVSTTGGRTWKWIETPIGGEPAIGSDSIFVYGNVNGRPMLQRIPKQSLWEYPEPDTQIYHLLRGEEIGQPDSGNNGVWFGRDLPYHLYTDFRFGIEADGQGNFTLWEDKYHGTAVSGFDTANRALDEDITSGFNEYRLTNRPNGGFSTEIFEQEDTDTLTVSVFVQAHR